MIAYQDIKMLALQAGGAVLGLIIFYWVRRILRGRDV